MNISLAFLRLFFLFLSILFMATFMLSLPLDSVLLKLVVGIGSGLCFGAMLIGFDACFRKFNLRAFNVAILGIFIGYLMGQALVLIFNSILDTCQLRDTMSLHFVNLIKTAILLFGTYLGSIMTLRAADEIYVSIPFVKFTSVAQKKKDLLFDASILSDARIIDVAATGLLDNQLIIPRFIIKELYAQSETGDELTKAKARRCLETIKKLESIPNLEMRINETDFQDVKEPFSKLIRLSRLLDANLLTADVSRIQMATIEGIRIINIHTLSHALKPFMQTGEYIKIKIQRYGKEPRQGVGYLEDGTMVVVNGGGDYIGDTIDTQVLSVKHTSSGRMIFCNALEDDSFKVYEEEPVDAPR
ncbi:MAG TPA: hypothetical protein VLG76_03255 [Rhabdochlamydiaceae bacterium]|nr:hypothetical protein [Rhabdochlamydiaceae bacterium]